MLMLMLLLQCLFPLFETDANTYTGLSILNSENQSRQFTIAAISADGNNVQAGQMTLSAGTQRALLLTEIFGASLATAASWLRVDSASTACTSYLATGNAATLAGVEAATAGGATVYLPHVSVNTGFMELAHTDTSVAVINSGAEISTVTAELFGLDGVLRGAFRFDVPSRGSRSIRVSDVFGVFIPNNNVGGKVFEGYVRLVSNAAVAAWQRVDTPVSRSVLRGRSSAEIASTSIALIPHFVFGAAYGGFINLINPTSTPINLEVTAVGDDGSTIGETVRVSLAPGEGRRSSIGAFFRVILPAIFPPPLISGHIRIRSQSGAAFQIVGNTQIFGSFLLGPQGSAMMSPIRDDSTMSWTMPFATSAGEYFTGYSIAVPNELLTVQTDVQVDVIGSDGTLVNRRTHSISPRGRAAALIPAGVTGGYVRFTSPLPFTVMGSIGTRDGQLLDQIPALR